MAAAQATADGEIEFPIDPHKTAWGLLLVACGGDIVTTAYGLERGLTESNPVVAAGIEAYGLITLIALTLAVIAWAVVIHRALGRRYGAAAAIGGALPKLIATVLNLLAITQL